MKSVGSKASGFAVWTLGFCLCAGALADEVPIRDGMDKDEVLATADKASTPDTVDLPFAGANPKGPLAQALAKIRAAIAAQQSGDGGETVALMPGTGVALSVTSTPVQAVPNLLDPIARTSAHPRLRGASSVMTMSLTDAGHPAWWQPSFFCTMQQDGSQPPDSIPAYGLTGGEGAFTATDSRSAVAEWALHDGIRLGVHTTVLDQHLNHNGTSLRTLQSHGRGAYASFAPWENVEIQFDVGSDQVDDPTLADATLWRGRTMTATWTVSDRASLQSSYSVDASAPSGLTPALRTRAADLTFTYALADRIRTGEKAANRFFLRLEGQQLRGSTGETATVEGARSWGVTLGFMSSTF